MSQPHFFNIAEHHVCIRFSDPETDNIALLPSFAPFSEAPTAEPLLFTLTIDNSLSLQDDSRLIRKVDTGNGDTMVYELADGGYQFLIRDINDRDCCLLLCNPDYSDCHCTLYGDYAMRTFGLNDALMLIYAFSGASRHTLLIHASTILYQGFGYPFIAKSGTGKSTHSSLWLKHIEGSELMNDDNPIVRLIDGKPYIYGSPWSGKTPCYRNVKAPLGAVTRIARATENSIERLSPIQAFASILPACSGMKWDDAIYAHLCDAITLLIESTPVYTLHCRPDEEAARLCSLTVTIDN